MAGLITFIITLPITLPLAGFFYAIVRGLLSFMNSILNWIVSILLPKKVSEVFQEISTIVVIIIAIVVAVQPLFMFTGDSAEDNKPNKISDTSAADSVVKAKRKYDKYIKYYGIEEWYFRIYITIC